MIGWEGLDGALGLGERELVSFVGGGGKTTAVFALGRHRPGRRIITTTTKMGVERTGGVPVLIAPTDAELTGALDDHGRVLVWTHLDDHRAVGVEPEVCDRWSTFVDTVAVEADGSRRRPFKAPREYEPVIPEMSTLVVACVGMAALDTAIAAGCHRPDRVAAIAGCRESDPLTPERLVRVLVSSEGSRKDVPEAARYAVLLNRATIADAEVVAEIEERLGAADVPLVVVADLAPADLPDRV